ncbi:MAG TPA: sugar phosphate isomerase/epimerase family protein [Methanomassiliicoccales archaeon]|nr:sugar phosphate isomerase/epimerase family protein [Methanomassiliicoccales archaeon]
MIAISSPHLSRWDFPYAIGKVAEHYQAWEIVAEGKHFLRDIRDIFLELSPSYDLEYSVHAPLSDVNIGAINPRMRAAALGEVLEALNIAHRMNIDLMTVHPGFMSPLAVLDRDTAVQATKESLKAIDARGKDLGVQIALENMPEMPVSMAKVPEELLEFIEGTELGVCFDIGHANTVGNIPDFLSIKERFINMHVHDNVGDRDRHMVIGEGNIDFRKWLGAFRPYRGRYVIEARELERSLVSRDRLRSVLASLD